MTPHEQARQTLLIIDTAAAHARQLADDLAQAVDECQVAIGLTRRLRARLG